LVRLSEGSNLLEIGPPRVNGALNSPIYDKNPEWFFDLRQFSITHKLNYFDLDMDEKVNPDFLGDLGTPVNPLPKNFFNLVICYSILEHIPDLPTAINSIYECLAPGGEVQFITPWDLRFHGPRPDCWRISDDGYRWLLREKFDIIDIEFANQSERELSPIALFVTAKKRH
jgi:SAM-dependent methyltransferase